MVVDQLSSMWSALAFLLAGVPLAALLDRLGFFEAVAATMAGKTGRDIPVVGLWVLAALTTVVLNLDTTVVLLTPLYLRLARRAEVDPVPLVAIPLLLASLASSVLPVSNLTTLIVIDRLGLGVADVFSHLALPSLVACTTAGSSTDAATRHVSSLGRSSPRIGTRSPSGVWSSRFSSLGSWVAPATASTRGWWPLSRMSSSSLFSASCHGVTCRC